MGFFSRKPKAIREIQGGAWGALVQLGIDVDTLSRDVRCVERRGTLNDKPVTFLRVFKLSEAAKKSVEVTGWETFDEHPGLLLYEGHLDARNEARFEPKRA